MSHFQGQSCLLRVTQVFSWHPRELLASWEVSVLLKSKDKNHRLLAFPHQKTRVLSFYLYFFKQLKMKQKLFGRLNRWSVPLGREMESLWALFWIGTFGLADISSLSFSWILFLPCDRKKNPNKQLGNVKIWKEPNSQWRGLYLIIQFQAPRAP